MAELIRGLQADRVRANVAEVRDEIAAACARAGRDPSGVELLAATKYVAVEELGVLADAGLTTLGENRMQDMLAKHEAWPGRFTFDFIGHLQSRKVKDVAPLVRRIHSVGSDSVLTQLARVAQSAPDLRILVEVNIAGEEGKSGIAPAELGAFLARSPIAAEGLMTMPPLADDPEASRPHFAALRELASGLEPRWAGRFTFGRLSMGTSQDFVVAAEEGATIVRVGSVLYSRSAG